MVDLGPNDKQNESHYVTLRAFLRTSLCYETIEIGTSSWGIRYRHPGEEQALEDHEEPAPPSFPPHNERLVLLARAPGYGWDKVNI
jgi:hypothetical protein